jgi:hypothetical protein
MPAASTPTMGIFHQTSVRTCGLDGNVWEWNMNGELLSRTSTSSPALFSLAAHGDAILAAGASPSVDLLRYNSLSISLNLENQ